MIYPAYGIPFSNYVCAVLRKHVEIPCENHFVKLKDTNLELMSFGLFFNSLCFVIELLSFVSFGLIFLIPLYKFVLQKKLSYKFSLGTIPFPFISLVVGN